MHKILFDLYQPFVELSMMGDTIEIKTCQGGDCKVFKDEKSGKEWKNEKFTILP